MEKNLDKTLEEIVNSENVTGCIVSDKQGLCLGCRGNAATENSGILTAIAEQAKKLSPSSGHGEPTIILESNDAQCIIQPNDKLVVSIYKKTTATS